VRTSETHPLVIGDSGPPGIEIWGTTTPVQPPFDFTIHVRCRDGLGGLLGLLKGRFYNDLFVRTLSGCEIHFKDVELTDGNIFTDTVVFSGTAKERIDIMPTCNSELSFDLVDLLKSGIQLKCGEHCRENQLSGFYAEFSQNNDFRGVWKSCGHGFTLEEALIEAKDILDGKIKCSKYKSLDDFRPQCDIIHEWFGLSYAQYLTVPRSVLQSMPEDWQQRFVDCLKELDDAIDWQPKNGTYRVQLMTTRKNWEEGGFVETIWDKELDDPLMDYQRGQRRVPKKAA
jgi:hypothetical protein